MGRYEMNKQEMIISLRNEIEDAENRRFYLSMKDNWDSSDYDFNSELVDKIKKAQNKINELTCTSLRKLPKRYVVSYKITHVDSSEEVCEFGDGSISFPYEEAVKLSDILSHGKSPNGDSINYVTLSPVFDEVDE